MTKPQHKTNYNGPGIYALFDVKKAKVYIGKSENVKRRFYNHNDNFRRKAENLNMYSEPIDNFVFVILLKMSEDEYETFGAVMELVYMREAHYMGFDLYNRRFPTDFQSAVSNELSTATGARRSISESVKLACGSAPCDILHSKDTYRDKIVSKLRSRFSPGNWKV